MLRGGNFREADLVQSLKEEITSHSFMTVRFRAASVKSVNGRVKAKRQEICWALRQTVTEARSTCQKGSEAFGIYFKAAVVMQVAFALELVHKKAYSRARGPDHLSESGLTEELFRSCSG